jgi:hypothetical protein
MAAATTPTRIIFAVVTHTDELSLQCTTSLLKLQQLAARRADLMMDFHIMNSVGDALNMYSKGDYVVIVDGRNGFSADFIFGAIEAGHKAVYGVYPLPQVDWERVKARVQNENATESLAHAGNVYNIVPQESSMSRYVPIKSIKESKVMILQAAVIESMVGEHTKTTKNGSEFHILHFESSSDNLLLNPDQTFFKSLQGHCTVLADLQEQCTVSGSAQFAGCVGQRGFVR